MTNLIPFSFESHEIRTTIIECAVWFVATDVAKALDYRDAEVAARHLDDDEKRVHQLGVPPQKVTLINESGLYALVLRSRKPEARKFAKWVTSEVLPSIRKTGGYGVTAPTPIVCTLPSHGRYLVVADNSGVRVFDAYDKSLLDAHLHRELRRDTHTLIAALAEWTKRARIVDGDASPKQLEQPLQIRFGECAT
ncbi:MAG: Bro-N domain-containing protein [Burkholderiales bacterium]|jgi:hypothetical protein|nr:Bro-N domain-containing protein [Burkholderiales bacterium]